MLNIPFWMVKYGMNFRIQEWRKTHKEHLREYMARYREKHREKIRNNHSKWRRKNNESVRKYSSTRRAKIKQQIFEILGSKCCRCGFDDKRALDVDHKFNNGNAERRIGDWTSRFAKYAANPKEARKNLQILCRNCNWIKHLESRK